MIRSRGLSRSARTISMRWRSPTLSVETTRRGSSLSPIGLEHPIELGKEFARVRGAHRGQARCSRAPSSPRTARSAGTPCRCRGGEPPADWGCGRGSRRRRSPLVGRENAVDHLDQRRLSGAVLAEQRVDLAGLDAQIDVVVRAHARKGLADADKLEPRGSLDVHVNFTSIPRSVRPRYRLVRRKNHTDAGSCEAAARGERFPQSPRSPRPASFPASLAASAAESNELAVVRNSGRAALSC